jgi:hypothetical protein
MSEGPLGAETLGGGAEVALGLGALLVVSGSTIVLGRPLTGADVGFRLFWVEATENGGSMEVVGEVVISR